MSQLKSSRALRKVDPGAILVSGKRLRFVIENLNWRFFVLGQTLGIKPSAGCKDAAQESFLTPAEDQDEPCDAAGLLPRAAISNHLLSRMYTHYDKIASWSMLY